MTKALLDKTKVASANEIVGILRCSNPNCITNQPNEPVRSKFKIVSKENLLLRCFYCTRYLEGNDKLKL